MSDFISIDDRISKYTDPEELIQATFVQLEKDAIMVGLPINFNGKVDLEDKVDQVQHWIGRIVNEAPDSLSGLFYRIDLDQQMAAEMLQESRGSEGVEKLSHLILSREFSKVILRREFS